MSAERALRSVPISGQTTDDVVLRSALPILRRVPLPRVSPAVAQGYDDALTEGRFARRAGFGGFTGAGVDDGASTTRGDENVRTP